METINSPQHEEQIQNPTIRSGKKTLIAVIVSIAVAIAIVISCIIYFRGDRNSLDTVAQERNIVPEIIYPIITERGVEPFCLGTSISDIPCKSTWYDTIIWKRYCEIFLGDAFRVFGEDELEEYVEYGEPITFFCEGDVLQNGNTVISVKTNEELKIASLVVSSNKLHLEKGIHIGSSVEMIDSVCHGISVYYDPNSDNSVFCKSSEIPDNIRLSLNGDHMKFWDYVDQYRLEDPDVWSIVPDIPITYFKGDTVGTIEIR